MRRTALTAVTVLASLSIASSAFAQANGRYVRGAGETVPTVTPGEKSGDLGFKPYSSSYLPIHEGPLAKEKDEEIKRQITKGFNDGECDLVHQIIKDNAEKATVDKLDTAADKEALANLSPFQRWLIERGWQSKPKPSDARARYLEKGYDPNAETWTGFCHNWAPAGLDPIVNFTVSLDKIYADVPFGVGDLRELATWSFPAPDWGGNYHWFGARNNSKDVPEAEADNLDPIDLLTIFENFVGPGKPGIVMDVDPGYMVWNQPFHKWSSKTTDVTGTDNGPKAVPPGGKVMKVRLDSTYGVEGNYGYRGETHERSIGWNMYVYTDASGKVVDSAYGAGSDKIPDFAWVNKTKGKNPDFERLERIAKEGISVKDIEEFCKTMASMPAGSVSNETAEKLGALLDKICPVLDQNKINDYIRKTAERTGQDYTNLDAAIRSRTAGHS